MRSLARYAWLAVVLVAGGDGFAQQAPAVTEAPLPEEPPKYRVEFILFAHAEADPYEELFDKEAGSDESLPPELSVLRDAPFGAEGNLGLRGDAVPTPAAPDDPTDELKPILLPGNAEPEDTTPFWFRVLAADELDLADTYARLDNLRAYHLLARGGWIQEGLDETAARPMDLANFGIVNPSGSLRLHVSRFLHLGVDLEFRAQSFADASAAADSPALAELVPMGTKYRMVAQRRARSGELHYVDHPMFGLLFLITPVKEEVVPVEDDTGVLAPAI
jgi:hypothetical protein